MTGAVADLVSRVAKLPAREPRSAPVAWLMDVDGVLNIIGPAPTGGWGEYARTGVMNGDGLMWPITYSPILVSLLNELHRKNVVSFRWLTTWEHDAPKILAPAIGLDIGRWVAGEDHGGDRAPTWWKLEIFAENLESSDELLIWTDDDIHYDHPARQLTDFLPSQQAVVICPNSSKGLMPQEFAIILDAIEERVGR